MAKELKLRRGTTAEHSTFTGAEGEVTIDTTKDTAVVHDGVTAGGIPLAKESDIPTGALASLNSVDASTIDDNSVGAAELNVPGNGTAGQYLASDGDGTMTWTTLAVGGGFSNMEVFTSPGTWTNPGNVEKVKVTVVGGGASGGSGSSPSTSFGGGGGGGGTAIEVIPFPSATNVTVTVGSGGTQLVPSISNGVAGGTSSFGAYCSATGGAGGSAGMSTPNVGRIAPGGAGGVGSGGQLNIAGSAGGSGGVDTDQGGVGGSSALGGGSLGSYPGSLSGKPGGAYGGGAGGGAQGGTPYATGSSGVVIVEY